MDNIRGDRPNGYFVTVNSNGFKIEGETRQCAHCQFTWEYQPGGGHKRGLCLSCNGMLCGNPGCLVEQKERLQYVVLYHPELAQIRCIRATEWNDMLAEDQLRIHGARLIPGSTAISLADTDLEGLQITPSGIVLKKS